MTFLIAVICLLAGLGAGIFALRPRVMKSLDVAVDMTDSSAKPDFSLSRSLLLIGPGMNDDACKEQRRELKRILGPLLEAEFKIIEIYGDLPPAENGEPYEWLDNQLLRKTLNAEEDFHLLHVNREGKTSFHSGRPISAEALLHIFDLWDYITEDAGEELTNVEDEEEPIEQVLDDFRDPADILEEDHTEAPTELVETAEPALETAKENTIEPVKEDQESSSEELAETELVSEQEQEEQLVASLAVATYGPLQPEQDAPSDVTTESEEETSDRVSPVAKDLAPGVTINGQARPMPLTCDEPQDETDEEREELLPDPPPLKRAPRSISQAIKRRMSVDG